MNKTKRSYNNQKRAIKAVDTKERIMRAFSELWMKNPLNEITLELIAEKANVTTRTILRKFGSKENLIEECLLSNSSAILVERENKSTGDIDESLRALLSSYETMGDAAIRTINLESESAVARKIGEAGRKVHRAWCMRVFAEHLPTKGSLYYERDLTAFIVGTEVYLWKLMRKDLKMSKKETFEVFKRMISGLIITNKV